MFFKAHPLAVSLYVTHSLVQCNAFVKVLKTYPTQALIIILARLLFLSVLRKSKTVFDFRFHDLDSGFQALYFRYFVDSSRCMISDSLNCSPDSKAQDSNFTCKNFTAVSVDGQTEFL